MNIAAQPCQFQAPTDDPLEPNDLCDTNRPPLGNGFFSNLWASQLKSDWYAIELAAAERLNVDLVFDSIFGDPTADRMSLALRSSCTGSGSAFLAGFYDSPGPVLSLSYMNPGPASQTYVLHIAGGTAGAFSSFARPLPEFGGCNSYDLEIAITDESNSTAYCFGNGNSTVNCPCGNDSSSNHPGGCAHQDGDGAILEIAGAPSVQMDTMQFGLTSAVRDSVSLLVSGDNALPQLGPCVGCGIAAFDGLRCAGGNLLRHGVRALNSAGATAQGWGLGTTPGGLIGQGAFTAGQTRNFFALMRSDSKETCGQGQNSSNGIRVTFLP